MEVCFATQNIYKLQEIQELLPSNIRLKSLSDLNFHGDIKETGKTLEENATIKALFCFERFNLPCFADDTGLEVSALNGEPGVHSARYAGEQKSTEDNIKLLLKKLTANNDRSAQFRTVICYIDEQGNKQYFTGLVKGRIINSMRGSHGFGYDPIFIPNGCGQSFAEMSMIEKNLISHRSKAIKKFVSYLVSLSK